MGQYGTPPFNVPLRTDNLDKKVIRKEIEQKLGQ